MSTLKKHEHSLSKRTRAFLDCAQTDAFVQIMANVYFRTWRYLLRRLRQAEKPLFDDNDELAKIFVPSFSLKVVSTNPILYPVDRHTHNMNK